MSQNPSQQITVDQLRSREIVVSDLVGAVAAKTGARRTAITAPSEPLSVFGRKMTGHDN
ncbi:hypothetical protein GCM10023063_17090 [Arthrobacter methylotrophus]|uniref:Uncharacterized protein n=1 Tax=Arthrobacter methylotrophus TaxID=121291 RepID=A0ABV5UNM2_9MICC